MTWTEKIGRMIFPLYYTARDQLAAARAEAERLRTEYEAAEEAAWKETQRWARVEAAIRAQQAAYQQAWNAYAGQPQANYNATYQYWQQPFTQSVKPAWAEVLQLAEWPTTKERAERAFKQLARKAHPDAGGSTEAMTRLNLAISQARKVLR